MKCLCVTGEHTTINLTPAELTGQKPMQPLLRTEHYQCMDSLFIRGSIRHCSLHCHAGYETNRQQVTAVSHTTLPKGEEHSIKMMHTRLLYTTRNAPGLNGVQMGRLWLVTKWSASDLVWKSITAQQPCNYRHLRACLFTVGPHQRLVICTTCKVKISCKGKQPKPWVQQT